MIDLYALHEEKAQDSLLTIHPSRWLYAGRQLAGSGVFDPFSREKQAIRVGDHIVQHFRQLSEIDLNIKGRHKHGYYFATSAVADRYFKYVPEGDMLECSIQDMLSVCHPDGHAEVHTPVGFIDLLLPSAVVEIKSFIKWKYALGQILAYSTYYPDYAKIIHLYVRGNQTPKLEHPLRICSQFNVHITYQNLLTSELGPMSRLSKIVIAS
ncbi:hypothetical protein [Mycetohabitans sp. B46]|uniref:hypothetical protein n=1 Tax=Mycetohabitans sp. B46 TaxID=2772536 RepID=UPI00307E3DAC